MNVLRATGVGMTIKTSVLLDDVSLTLAEGEWLSVIGPNGAGKSTLLRALAGGDRSTGTIELFGQTLGDLPQRDRARLVSWIPQSPVIPSGMSVLDYVLLGRTPHLHPFANVSSADVEVARSVLDDLDLLDLADRSVDTLSGGERQRAVIGRALTQDAPVIFLDEPTTSLDLGHQQEVLRLLDRLRSTRNRSIITTMHDLTLAGQFCDRLVMLAGGQIVAEGRALEVLTEDNIARHYGALVDVTTTGESVVVVPRIDHPHQNQTKEHPDGYRTDN